MVTAIVRQCASSQFNDIVNTWLLGLKYYPFYLCYVYLSKDSFPPVRQPSLLFKSVLWLAIGTRPHDVNVELFPSRVHAHNISRYISFVYRPFVVVNAIRVRSNCILARHHSSAPRVLSPPIRLSFVYAIKCAYTVYPEARGRKWESSPSPVYTIHRCNSMHLKHLFDLAI